MKRTIPLSALAAIGALLAYQVAESAFVALAILAIGGLGIIAIWFKRGRLVVAALFCLGIAAAAFLFISRGAELRCRFDDPAGLPTLTPPAGYVYVIQDLEYSKLYKIGRSNNPARRLKEIRAILPGQSEIIAILKTEDAATLEWQLHQRYADARKNGEWFALDGAQVREICAL